MIGYTRVSKAVIGKSVICSAMRSSLRALTRPSLVLDCSLKVLREDQYHVCPPSISQIAVEKPARL